MLLVAISDLTTSQQTCLLNAVRVSGLVEHNSLTGAAYCNLPLRSVCRIGKSARGNTARPSSGGSAIDLSASRIHIHVTDLSHS
jgi:hypothetical protein